MRRRPAPVARGWKAAPRATPVRASARAAAGGSGRARSAANWELAEPTLLNRENRFARLGRFPGLGGGKATDDAAPRRAGTGGNRRTKRQPRALLTAAPATPECAAVIQRVARRRRGRRSQWGPKARSGQGGAHGRRPCPSARQERAPRQSTCRSCQTWAATAGGADTGAAPLSWRNQANTTPPILRNWTAATQLGGRPSAGTAETCSQLSTPIGAPRKEPFMAPNIDPTANRAGRGSDGVVAHKPRAPRAHRPSWTKVRRAVSLKNRLRYQIRRRRRLIPRLTSS